MNKARRREAADIGALVLDALQRAEALRDDEQAAYDNLPESLQGGDKGEAMAEALDQLNEICDALENAKDALGAIENQ